jgi:hypothetical protein
MTIESVLQTELTASERGVLEEDRKRWKHIGEGAHLDEWLAFGPGLDICRRLAMKLAHTNRPEGRGYTTAMAQVLRHYGMAWSDPIVKSSMTAVLWLNDDPERMTILRDIREAMTPGQRSRLNSPISARKRIEAELKARRAPDAEPEEARRTAPLALMKARNAELERKLAHVEEQLASAETGSLFDLKHDTAAAIGQVVVNTVSEHKAKAIMAAIKEGLATKRQRPAG